MWMKWTKKKDKVELKRTGVIGDPKLMRRWLMVWTETKSRAVSHIGKGKWIQPETVRLETDRDAIRWGSPQKSMMEENLSLTDYKKWMWHTGVNFQRKGKGSKGTWERHWERQKEREEDRDVDRSGERVREREKVLSRKYFIEKLKIMKFDVWKNLEKLQKDIFTDTTLHIHTVYNTISRKSIFSVILEEE